jgi:hypothetical protein
MIYTLAVINANGITLTPNAKPRPAPSKVRCPRCRVLTASYCACGVKHV